MGSHCVATKCQIACKTLWRLLFLSVCLLGRTVKETFTSNGCSCHFLVKHGLIWFAHWLDGWTSPWPCSNNRRPWLCRSICHGEALLWGYWLNLIETCLVHGCFETALVLVFRMNQTHLSCHQCLQHVYLPFNPTCSSQTMVGSAHDEYYRTFSYFPAWFSI